MFKKYHYIYGYDDDNGKNVEITYPEICPVCHTRVRPDFIYGHMDDSSDQYFSVLFSCSCGNIFMSKYQLGDSYYGNYSSEYKLSVPNGFEGEKFDDRISAISKDFVEVYNQSLEAETLGLKAICGAGYRKAIEYLIKSYCSLLDPKNEKQIWNENLGSTINRIEDKRMRALYFATKEIGNDQTHTIIKLSEGIPEMKEYIQALVAYINFIGLSNIATNNYQRDEK